MCENKFNQTQTNAPYRKNVGRQSAVRPPARGQLQLSALWSLQRRTSQPNVTTGELSAHGRTVSAGPLESCETSRLLFVPLSGRDGRRRSRFVTRHKRSSGSETERKVLFDGMWDSLWRVECLEEPMSDPLVLVEIWRQLMLAYPDLAHVLAIDGRPRLVERARV